MPTDPSPGAASGQRNRQRRLGGAMSEAGAEAEPGGAHPKCCQGMSHDVIAAEGEGRCVGPRSGDTITAMSSCVRTPEPVRAW